VFALLVGDEGEALGEATADGGEVGGVAVGFQKTGGLGEEAQQAQIAAIDLGPIERRWLKGRSIGIYTIRSRSRRSRGRSAYLGMGLKPEVNPAGLPWNFPAKFNLTKGAEEFL